MTPPKDNGGEQRTGNGASDDFWVAPGKTILDVAIYVPSRLPKWTGIWPFNLLRLLPSLALFIVLAICVVSYRQRIGNYLFNEYPALKTSLQSSSPAHPDPSPAKPAPLRIAYFNVNPTSGGWAAQDGRVQKQGFEAATAEFSEENGSQAPEPRDFIYDKNAHLDVLSQMKELYEKKSIRVFIVTMSAVVKPLKGEFKIWRDTIPNLDDRPVLIATVTSAPDVADIKNGILRFYIRSEDEATSLAQYTWYKYQPKNVGVFHIADAYGRGGAETFATELHKLKGPTPRCYPISMDQEDIGGVIANWIQNEGATGACAFIVGYGDMLKRTIEELDKQNFSGPILCASTITHEKWKPSNSAVRTTMVTVVPDRLPRSTNYPQEDYDVVRFFSKLTLLKALDCAQFTKTTSEFIERWQTTAPLPPQKKDKANEYGLSVIYSTDGDAIIKLRIEEMHP
jgi:hypothetical protein